MRLRISEIKVDINEMGVKQETTISINDYDGKVGVIVYQGKVPLNDGYFQIINADSYGIDLYVNSSSKPKGPIHLTIGKKTNYSTLIGDKGYYYVLEGIV